MSHFVHHDFFEGLMDELLGQLSFVVGRTLGHQRGRGKAHLVLHAATVGAPATRPVLQRLMGLFEQLVRVGELGLECPNSSAKVCGVITSYSCFQ